jgi:hypothetical protein
VLCSHKNDNNGQPINVGFFDSLDATWTTKQNTDTGFGPLDTTQVHQRLRSGSLKRTAGYQSRQK